MKKSRRAREWKTGAVDAAEPRARLDGSLARIASNRSDRYVTRSVAHGRIKGAPRAQWETSDSRLIIRRDLKKSSCRCNRQRRKSAFSKRHEACICSVMAALLSRQRKNLSTTFIDGRPIALHSKNDRDANRSIRI